MFPSIFLSAMKYFLLIVSVILIIYPIIAILKCFESITSLSNYGMGVLIAGLLIFFSGILLMYFTVKSIKNKKSQH